MSDYSPGQPWVFLWKAGESERGGIATDVAKRRTTSGR